MTKHRIFTIVCIFGLIFSVQPEEKAKRVLVPQIDGEWSYVTGNPMDHKFATERQEPVDFAVWQASDSTWQLWSCMRKTTAGGENGKTRFFADGRGNI